MTALVAHAGGFSWDELLLFATPVLVLIVLQVLGRRRRDSEGQDEGDDGEAG